MGQKWLEITDFVQKYITFDLAWQLIVKIVGSLIIIIAGKLIIKYGNSIIEKILKKDQDNMSSRRKNTLIMLLKSILRYGVYFFAVMLVLSLFNVPIASLLAGAGIIGVAIGFGGQNLVKDVINGFFILFEDQFAVGDYVKAAGAEGIVEEIGLRTTHIRNFGGELHIIPNGEIGQVTNYSAGNMRVMVDVGVTYEQDPEKVINVLEELCQEIGREKRNVITDGPTVLGVQELASSSVVFRIWAKVKPMEQWQISRYIKKRIKERLDERGIEIAYPHMVLVPKKGNSVEEIKDEI